MFGILRFILSIIVLASHTCGPLWIGNYAVFIFFSLSGYLITHVLKEFYLNYSVKGIICFYKNRVLRIFPLYWLSLLITVIIFSIIPDTNSSIVYPSGTYNWIQNIFLFNLSYDSYRLNPPAWSLNIEIIFYLIIPILLLNRLIYFSWISFNILFIFILFSDSFYLSYNVFSLVGASLPICLGSLVYFLPNCQIILNNNFRLYTSLILILLLMIFNIFSNKYIFDYNYVYKLNFHINIILACILTYLLKDIKIIKLLPTDKFLGILSYPIFILHYSLIFIFVYLLNMQLFSYKLFLYTLVLSIFASIIIFIYFEKFFQAIRVGLKNKLIN